MIILLFSFNNLFYEYMHLIYLQNDNKDIMISTSKQSNKEQFGYLNKKKLKFVGSSSIKSFNIRQEKATCIFNITSVKND